METTERRGKPVDTPNTVSTPPRKRRSYPWLIILPFVVSALILVPMAFVRGSTEVEMRVKATRVSFVSGRPSGTAPFFGSMPLASLQLGGFEEVRFRSDTLEVDDSAAGEERFPGSWRGVESGSEVRIRPTSRFAQITLYDIALNELEVPAGLRVAMEWSPDSPQKLGVSVRDGRIQGSAGARETLLAVCDHCAIEGVTEPFESVRIRAIRDDGRVIRFVGTDNRSTVTLEAAVDHTLVVRDIPVSAGLDFSRLAGGRLISSIAGGTLRFPAVDREQPITPGDFVVVEDIGAFFLRELEVRNGLQVLLHGTAGDLAVGPEGFLDHPLPSALERVYANESWLLLVNAIIVVATTGLGVIRKLRLVEEG